MKKKITKKAHNFRIIILENYSKAKNISDKSVTGNEAELAIFRKEVNSGLEKLKFDMDRITECQENITINLEQRFASMDTKSFLDTKSYLDSKSWMDTKSSLDATSSWDAVNGGMRRPRSHNVLSASTCLPTKVDDAGLRQSFTELKDIVSQLPRTDQIMCKDELNDKFKIIQDLAFQLPLVNEIMVKDDGKKKARSKSEDIKTKGGQKGVSFFLFGKSTF